MLWPCCEVKENKVSRGYFSSLITKISTYSFVIFEPVLILVCLFTTDDGAPEWFRLLIGKDNGCIGDTGQKLLFADATGDIAIWTVLGSTELEVGIGRAHATARAEEALGWFVDAEIDHVIIVTVEAAELVLVLAHGVILHTEVTKATHHAFVYFCRGPWSGRIGCVSEL